MENSSRCVRCDNCLHELCMYKVPLFSHLDRAELEEMACKMIPKYYEKGEIILHAGTTPNGITVISMGSAKAVTYTADGREQILYLFSQNDYFGDRFLFSDEKSTFTVEALQNTSTCTLLKADFQELVAKYPNIAIQVIGSLSSRVAHLESALQNMGSRSAEVRISSLILEYIDMYGSPTKEGTLITLPLSREGIANYLGIARETLSRKLSQLEGVGILKSEGNKSILIKNIEALKSLSHG